MSVAPEMLTSGSAFTIQLPTEVKGSIAISQTSERVTLDKGGELPSWIQYNSTTKTFEVNQAPEGGLPLTVRVSVGDANWSVIISKKKSD